MVFIEFTDANKVNIQILDEQHRKLFSLLNQLHKAVTGGKEQGEFANIFDGLIEYTVYHCNTEEELCLEHEYPGYAEQKKAHDQLAATILSFQQQMHDGSATLSFELLDFLHNWLMEHTLGLDQKMGPYLNERGVT